MMVSGATFFWLGWFALLCLVNMHVSFMRANKESGAGFQAFIYACCMASLIVCFFADLNAYADNLQRPKLKHEIKK